MTMKRAQVYFILVFFLVKLIQLTKNSNVNLDKKVKAHQVTLPEASKENKSQLNEQEPDIVTQISTRWCGSNNLPETMIDSVYNCFWKSTGDLGYLLQVKCENELFSVSSMSKNAVRKVICNNDKEVTKKISNCHLKYSQKAYNWIVKKVRLVTTKRPKVPAKEPLPTEKEDEEGWKKNTFLLDCMKKELHIESISNGQK